LDVSMAEETKTLDFGNHRSQSHDK
jgi:hypothetical protein